MKKYKSVGASPACIFTQKLYQLADHVLSRTFVSMTICIVYVVMLGTACAQAADVQLQKSNISMNTQSTKSKQQNFQVDNIKKIVADIPKIATINQNRMHIDFLQNTELATPNSENSVRNNDNVQEKVLLGRKHGKNIYYMPSNIQATQPAKKNIDNIENDNSIDGIITYNHNRKLLGVFYGRVDIVLQNEKNLAEVLQKYNASIIIHSGKYATIQLIDIYNVADVYKNMIKDEKIDRIKLDLNENTIVIR